MIKKRKSEKEKERQMKQELIAEKKLEKAQEREKKKLERERNVARKNLNKSKDKKEKKTTGAVVVCPLLGRCLGQTIENFDYLSCFYRTKIVSLFCVVVCF